MSDPRTAAPGTADSLLVPGVVVAGYRLLRQVPGTGDVWLAKAPGSAQTLCVWVQRPTEAVDRQVTAHGSIRSPHVLALVDVATDGAGRVVLAFERTDWTLATLLASRARVAPGEAVTVLAPLAAGLAAIHRAGFCSGELTPAAVLFCPDGRPVLGRLSDMGHALHGFPDSDRPPAGVSADHRSFANLIVAVAQLVDEPARSKFTGVADWITEQALDEADSGSLLGQVECRLFAVAPALPVVLVADRRATATANPSRHRRSPAMPSGPPSRGATDRLHMLRRALPVIAASGLGGWVQRMLRGRAFALCLGIVLLVMTLLAGLAAIPESTPASRLVPREPKPSAGPAPPEPSAPQPAADQAPGEDATVGGDDPVTATVALLRLRANCVKQESTTCVSRYAEPASALADADTRALSGPEPGGILLIEGRADPDVQLLQSYGDAVLLHALPADEKRQPVIVLTVRTDTGWRLRDLFEPD